MSITQTSLARILSVISDAAGVDLVNAEPFSDGISNKTFSVKTQDGSSLVLKLGRRGRAWKIRKDATLLQGLRGHIPVPRVIWVSEIELQDSSGAMLMEYVLFGPSKAIAGNLPLSFFHHAARILVDLHSENDVTRELISYLKTLNNSGLDAYEPTPFTQKCSRASSLLNYMLQRQSQLLPMLEKLYSRMKEQEPLFASGTCSLTHDDLALSNILTDGAQVRAVIDFENAKLGDPACDLHFFCQSSIEWGAKSSMLAAFLDEYTRLRPLPPNFEAKGPFYRYFRAFQRVAAQAEQVDVLPEIADQLQSNSRRLLQNLIDFKDPCLARGVYRAP